MLFTLAPILAFGTLDKDVDEDLMDEFPQLYASGINKYHVRNN